MDKQTLNRIFLAVWVRETSAFPDLWSQSNPAVGQCLPTAWIAKEKLGGRVMQGFWQPLRLIHFWNILPSGEVLDFTSSQFQNVQIPWNKGSVKELDKTLFNEYLKAFPKTKERYQLFWERFQSIDSSKKL